jgi:hypothetical protein
MSYPDIDGNVSKADLQGFIEEYKLADEEVASALKGRRDVRNRIKESGFDPDSFDWSRSSAELSGELRERQFYEYRRNLAWMDKPVGDAYVAGMGNGVDGIEPGTRISDEEATIADATRDRVEVAGYDAGYAGAERRDNPWTPGSLLAGDWDNGWQRGEATRAEEGDDAPKRKPGRPPGARNKPKGETTH